jgi:sulfide:quinone oxidoreductase
VWPLPAYELALMTAGEARGMGFDDVQVTVVTPERVPLVAFGPEAGQAIAEELGHGGVRLVTNAVAVPERDGMTLLPSGDHVAVGRIYAVPRIVGPALAGLPADEEGFVRTGDDMRVEDATRTWAAGDAVVSPVKFGGLATHMARVAIAGIARTAGVEAPDPGEPVLEGRLLVGKRTRRLRGRGDDEASPLWWPQGKVTGVHLPRWLTQHGITPPLADDPVPGKAVEVRRTLSEVRRDTDYLARLGRDYRIADPALGALGRRMREMGG